MNPTPPPEDQYPQPEPQQAAGAPEAPATTPPPAAGPNPPAAPAPTAGSLPPGTPPAVAPPGTFGAPPPAGPSGGVVAAVVGAAVGLLVVLVAIGAAVFIAVSHRVSSTATAPAPPAAAATSAAPTTGTSAGSGTTTGACTWQTATAGNPNTKDVGTPPAGAVTHSGTRTMTITTNLGVVEIQMDAARTPCTAASFAYLAGKHFFDNSPCHRLTTTGIFVLQCGDPSGTGSGGPAYQFADENLTATSGVYPRGMVAMANAGPGTNGSQFFITYKDSPLDPNYTPFGTVTKGLDIIDRVAAAGDSGDNGPGDGHPKLAVTIKSVTVS